MALFLTPIRDFAIFFQVHKREKTAEKDENYNNLNCSSFNNIVAFQVFLGQPCSPETCLSSAAVFTVFTVT